MIRQRRATDKEALFAKHYAVSRNGRRAAIAAGYAEASATSTASVLLRKPKVQDMINEALNESLAKAQANVDWVVRKWLSLGMADARDLIENHRDACRYCHGVGHGYQWTAGEWQRAQDKFERDSVLYNAEVIKAPPIEPKLQGGLGFDPRRGPHEDCPECFGRGVPYQHINDTRHLSESAAQLYDGLKVTERGLEVKTRSRDLAVGSLAKHLGMLAERHLHGGLPPDFDWDKATPEQIAAIAAGKKPT